MVSSYTTNKYIEKPANGDYNNTWSTPVNSDWDVIDTAFGGTTTINAVGASGTVTLSIAQYRPPVIAITGALTANVNYQLPAGVGGFWYIFNNTSGAFSILFSSAGGGSTVTVPQGYTVAVICDGTNVGLSTTNAALITSSYANPSWITSLAASKLTGAVAVTNGGTGQTTYTDGQLLIGNSTGNTLTKATLTAGTGIAITNSAGGITIATAAGGGTVTSVAMTVPSFLSVTGSPITTSGTLAVTLSGTALPVANGGTGATTLTGVLKGNGTSAFSAATAGTDYVAPGGALGTPSSGNLANCTFPTLNQNTTGTAANVTGTVAVANGGTGATTLTGILKGNGTSAFSAATAGTDYVAPGGALGTPSSGTLTNCTFPTLNQNTTGSSGSCTGNSATATLATTATTANALNTGNNYQVNSLGVGTAASGTAGEIRATNNVTAYYSSDARLKENVQPIQNALGIVSAVGGKTFDWTDAYIADHGGEDGYFVQKSDFGVIAQDVQGAFPLAVRTREDGTLAVDYEKLVAVAFAAIDQLKAEVNELRQEVDELRQQAVKVIK
jgi:hypothetical protein